MTAKTGLIIGIGILLTIIGITIFSMYININDEANTRLQEIKGYRSKVEVSLDVMNKTITQQIQTTNGEKDAFLEFQRLVSDSKKDQSIGGIMTQIQEKYPTFDIKGFDKIMQTIEIKCNEFATEQNAYNSRVVAYNQFIVKTVNKFFLSSTHVEVEQFVISSSSAKESIETGKDEQTEIRDYIESFEKKISRGKI